MPDDVADVHLSVEAFTAFQEKEHLTSGMTLHTQALPLTNHPEAGKHHDDALRLEVKVDLAFAQLVLHRFENALATLLHLIKFGRVPLHSSLHILIISVPLTIHLFLLEQILFIPLLHEHLLLVFLLFLVLFDFRFKSRLEMV